MCSRAKPLYFTDFKPGYKCLSHYPYYLPSYHANFYPSWRQRYARAGETYPTEAHVQFKAPTYSGKTTLHQHFDEITPMGGQWLCVFVAMLILLFWIN